MIATSIQASIRSLQSTAGSLSPLYFIAVARESEGAGTLWGDEDTLSLPGRISPPAPPPSSMGPYRLLRILGEGGTGQVWLAEQVSPIRRRVAVKVIKIGMDTKQVVARFESERQALALMEHPAIAKVIDGGSTAEGRPFFVMEYVPGLPITAHCDQHELSTQERLALFVRVCEGVQHAHQKAIIHRDLKPSNVLVSLVDGKAAPKIIDFGIAKAIGQRLTDRPLLTEMGTIIGTPEYMSPEQADPANQDIDTRADIYSLGVILYQLLTRHLPFGSHELRTLTPDELRRSLQENDPPRPSARVRSLGGTESRSLARELRGDLDAIILKALEKDRTRRYAAPSELAADIGRYLRNEPVIARPPSRIYRMQKSIRRHRLAVLVAATMLGMLTALAATMSVQARRVALERDRANRESEASRRVADFMAGMFEVSDPGETRGNAITAREILDKASREIQTGLAQDPELQARLMGTMGTVYENLGLYAQAEPLLKAALETRSRLLGPAAEQTLRSRNEWGELLVK